MTFKSALEIDCGLRFMYDTLDIISPCGRKMLLEGEMMTTKREIDFHYRRLNEIYDKDCTKIAHKLMCLKDIHTTLSRLENGTVLDDIELFEVKYLAIVSSEVLVLLQEQNIVAVGLPHLEKVVEILDPDGVNIPSFYVYDSYSDELREVRKQIKAIQGNGEELPDDKRQQLAVLLQRNADLELEIREMLSGRLREFAGDLSVALRNLSFLDILIAKAGQMKKLGLCFPVVVEDGETFYNGMFNPAVKDALVAKGKEYMPVDIEFEREPVTIIGANMGGKTVVLKSLALNQLLTQFGFGVAAHDCCVNLVDEVALCIGDDQSIEKGISSFAAEMMAINKVVLKIREGRNMLALVDEPARTTNPVEGTALVEGLLDVLGEIKGGFVLTTHYNILNGNVKRYRVKGLRDNIMDYTLEVTHCGDVPHEAVAIAESLGIDLQWIECTKRNLNN
ncbi:MAG: DNA mismatch repair protein MutS [Bacteroidales bacterium]|nr:DNA mismatch repair protein MutS [Bacteroidales bacterium]